MKAVVVVSSTSSSSSLPSLKPHFYPSLPKLNHHSQLLIKRKIYRRNLICRAEFSRDAPFAAAIGASLLSSLLLPKAVDVDADGDSAFDSTDARFTAMAIISFIPYFNWLSWVFAWLDTGKRRYAVYALVYLAPYIRSNMSLSLEESWLPVASIVLGIIHVQLESSIKNGDLEGFQFFSEAAKFLFPLRKTSDFKQKDHLRSSDEESREHDNLTSGEQPLRNEIQDAKKIIRDENRKSGAPREHSKHHYEQSHYSASDDEEEPKD